MGAREGLSSTLKLEKEKKQIPPGPPEGKPALHLGFCPVRPTVDFWPQNYQVINLCCCKQTNKQILLTLFLHQAIAVSPLYESSPELSHRAQLSARDFPLPPLAPWTQLVCSHTHLLPQPDPSTVSVCRSVHSSRGCMKPNVTHQHHWDFMFSALRWKCVTLLPSAE